MKITTIVFAMLLAPVTSATAQEELATTSKDATADEGHPADVKAGTQPQQSDSAKPGSDDKTAAQTGSQSPSPQTQGAQQEEDSSQFEDIVVTATKRDASIRDVPISIDAFRGEDLVEQGARNLDSILKNTPGVNVSGKKVAIRGMALTSQLTLQSGEEAGRFLGDASLNAPSTQGGLGDLDPYDMGTVEILKGPQSTLFGGTALSGAIRYVPNKPNTERFAASVQTGYGNIVDARAPAKDLSAMLNVPVGDTFAVRAVGSHLYKPNVAVDTFGHLPNTDSNTLAQTRYLARWAPTDRLSFDLTYFNHADTLYFTFLDNPNRRETNKKRMEEPFVNHVKTGILKVQYGFDAFSVFALANGLKSVMDFNLDAASVLGTESQGAVPLVIHAEAKAPSYELRLVSNLPSESQWSFFAGWDYLLALYYMKADQIANQVITDHGAVAATNDNHVNVSERALFTNLTHHYFDGRLDLNLGARLAQTTLVGNVYLTTGPVPRSFDSDEPGKRVNPSLATTWHLTDDLNIRAAYSEGFRFGGTNGAVTVGIEDIPPNFKSDSLTNYEIGLRSDWLDSALRVDITPFEMQWKDMQLTQISPLGFNYVTNVGAAKIDGIETQVRWRIPDDWSWIPEGLTLLTSHSYLAARTTEAVTSANGTAPAGSRLPLSPRNSAALGLSWEHRWKDWNIRTGIQGYYSGDRKNDLIETYRLPGYETLAASFRIGSLALWGRPAISLTGSNLTNKLALYNATPIVSQPGNFVYVPQGDPRTIKLSLEMGF